MTTNGLNRCIYFCFPSKSLGGVSHQFLRVAKKMLDNGHNVALIDYVDGVMGRETRKLGVPLIRYHDERPIKIPNNAILILQAMTPWTIFEKLTFSPESKILFWACHPSNFVPSLPLVNSIIQNPNFGSFIYKLLFPITHLKMKRFIQILDDLNGLIYIDEPCRKSNEYYYNLDLKRDRLVPVPAPLNDVVVLEKTSNRRVPTNKSREEALIIKMGWLGRIADFKFPILSHTLIRICQEAVDLNAQVEFHIIGDGPYLEELKNLARVQENIKVIFHGEISQKEAIHTLIEKIDLVFAMGTAALEAAALGKATVLLNFTYNKKVQYHYYEWLHQGTGFSVGQKISNRKSKSSDNLRFILDEYLTAGSRHSKLSREYVENNHNLEEIVKKLESHINKNQFTHSLLQQLNVDKKPLAYAAYRRLRKPKRT